MDADNTDKKITTDKKRKKTVLGLSAIIDLINFAVNSRGRQLKSKCCVYTKITWLKAKRLPIGAIPKDSPIAQLAKKYTPRGQDETVKEFLTEGTNYPLLVGSSWVGKTRSVYEILKNSAKHFLRGYWVVWPHRDIDEKEIALLRDFPWRRPKVILFFDNIDWYVQTGKHHRIAAIIERFQAHSKELRVVATLRSDPEDIKAVELLKQDAAWQKFKEVDYNLNKPPFILQTRQHLEYMQAVYRRLAENERKILWALKILRRGMVSPRDIRTKALFVEILNGEEGEFEAAIKRLQHTGFAGSPRPDVTEVHDTYLERVVDDFPEKPDEIWQFLHQAAQLFEKDKDDDAINRIGISFHLNEEYDDAVKCFDAILKITNEKNSAAWNNKGLSMYELGRYEEALKCCKKALELREDFPGAWHNKGLALNALGRHEEAIQCYNKALKLIENFHQAFGNKGNALAELGKREKRPELFHQAIECYRKVLEITGFKDPKAWNNKGSALTCLARLENKPELLSKAIECYNKALKLREDYAEAWYNKGNAFAHLERYEEAKQCFKKALELREDYPEAWYNKGNALAALGRYQEAIDCCNKALELRPDYPEAWNNKGTALYELGRYEEARKCFDKALKLRKDYPDALNNKGNALAELGRLENDPELFHNAIECYDKALELRKDYPDALSNKGAALAGLGRLENKPERFQEAIECCDKALELTDFKHAGAWYNKACAFAGLKEKENMLKALKEAVRLDPKNKEKAQKDEDFKAYWEDEDFKAVVK